MDFNDYPNYFQAASKAGVKYQHYYKSIRRSAVIALILAVVVTIYSFQQPQYSSLTYAVVGVLALFSFILAMVLLTKKYDQIAQQAYSLKVSCKTLSWQFIMGVGEFDSYEGSNALKSAFENRIQLIVNEFDEVLPYLDTAVLKQDVITEKMLELRSATFQEKKSYYTQNRIQSLIDLYFEKAIAHHRKYKLWSINLTMSQFLALVALGYLIFDINTNWSVIALVTMLVSSVVSWLELQQNLEKKQAYALGLKELDYIEKGLSSVGDENELSEFIWDAEKVISGPNTLWLVSGKIKKNAEAVL